MNDLQLTLIVVGIGAIGAVLLHGLWVLRRQGMGQKNQAKQESDASDDMLIRLSPEEPLLPPLSLLP